MGEGCRLELYLGYPLAIQVSYKPPIGTICGAATGGDTVIKYSLLDSISSHLLELSILLLYYLWCILLMSSCFVQLVGYFP